MEDNKTKAQNSVIETILGKGMKFRLTYTMKTRERSFSGFFRPKVKVEKQEDFVIKEPTLAVLDRASEVWLRMSLDGIDKEGADTLNESYKMAHEHSHDMAECLAILVLGEAYYAVDGGDEEELGRLTELFYKSMKPSQCKEIAFYINAASNLADFVSSTRLMKMSSTTAPTARVE